MIVCTGCVRSARVKAVVERDPPPPASPQVEAGVDEALDSGSWVDAATLAPAALAASDVAALLARCPSVQRLSALP